LAIFLLAKQFVTFDQALILILLAAFLEGVMRREPPSPRDRGSMASTPFKNERRR
jgi:hypothetical protein